MDAELRDAACDRAYRDHAADVYRVAYSILRNPDEALDATHDAFARAWERWEQYDSQRPLRPWLFGIVAHIALDNLRKLRVRRLGVGRAGVDASPTALYGDPATGVVDRRVVEQAMANLPPVTRAALVLRHYYGYDYAQIAEILGKPSGTIGSLLTRGHAALRERLTEPTIAAASPSSNASRTTDSPISRQPDPIPDSRRH